MRAFIVSVRYADFLAQSLVPWRKFLPPGTLTVLTSPDDVDTIAVAARAKVPVFATTAWAERDDTCHVTTERPKFNVPLALDHAFGFVGSRPPPALGELCLSVDADVVPFGVWPAEETFEPDVLYGLYRYKCNDHQHLVAHRRGLLSLQSYAFMQNNRPAGYAKVFRYRPGLRFGSYPSAGNYDFDFGELFPRREMRQDNVYVLHMGKRGGYHNWRSRTIPLWDTRPPEVKAADVNKKARRVKPL